MKPLYNICLIITLLTCSLSGYSQNQSPQRPTRQRATETVKDNTPILTERAKIKNEVTSQAPVHINWLREMYRFVYLDEKTNAALYYPEQPIGDRMNLFTIIFKLMADGKISAYKYYDGREAFIDTEKVDFEDILKKYHIIYEKQGTGDNTRYNVRDNDIPSYEVTIYYIKEGHYFDAATGMYKSQVIALCPLLVRKDYDVGDTTKDPLFWIPYENLRPYLSRVMIMTSDYNNVMTYSIDDFFTKGMYKGEIVKTVNMRNQSLAEQVGGNDPERLKLAQDSIENQLKTFKNQLWIQQDTTQVAAANKSDKKGSVKRETAASARGDSGKKEQKPKAAKTEKSSAPASPTKSVRRTR